MAAVLISGCTGGDEDDTAPPETGTAPETDEPTEDAPADDGGEAAGDDGDGEAEGDADGDGETVAPPPSTAGPVLASVEHPLAELDGSLDIELRAEEVGELLRVEITFTPRDIGDERTSIAELFGSSGSGNGMSALLIDPVNLLEYETVRRAVPHGQPTPAYEDQPTTLNFYFGAPVEPLETFDFLLQFASGAPDWPGFVDVPLATN